MRPAAARTGEEDGELKRLVADRSLDREALKTVIRKTVGACRPETGPAVLLSVMA